MRDPRRSQLTARGRRAVRPPAVSGAFYPADAGRLSADVQGFLSDARAAPSGEGEAPKALIVPHAGYVYSGPVAASAYAALGGAAARIERVVMFGPAHRVAVRGLAVPSVDVFATPMGDVPIDRAALERAAALPQVVVDDRPHALEHSLEVQIPFLQQVLGSFQLVPFVVGDASADEVAEVMELLWGGPETLIVVSSDLSHYYDHATARRLDAATSRTIESLDPSGLGAESACGRIPVRGLLVAARAHGLRVEVLDLRNSGDTAGPRDQVVGYGAYALFERTGAQALFEDTSAQARFEGTAAAPVSEAARSQAGFDRQVLELARHAVEYAVRTGETLPVDLAELPARLGELGACFVTLERRGRLRGCIGELESERALAMSIAKNAHAAALCDPRFSPLDRTELADLRVKVSLLAPLEDLDVTSREELLAALRPGVDGVVLAEGAQRATLLPAVWATLPGPEAFVNALERKAGLSRGWSPDRRVRIFQAREIA